VEELRIRVTKEPIAVFGFTDPVAGQLEIWVDEFTDYEISFLPPLSRSFTF